MGVVDTLLANPYQVLAAVQIAALLAASALLAYPTVAYAQNVAYTEGLVGLATGFFLLTISNTVGVLIDADLLAPAVDHTAGITSIINLGASVAATIGIYYFARQFIQTDSTGFETTDPEGSGGFDDADD
ncbi:hypothetical protein [Halorubellus sp. PRR65]|uniref:hypothetical protein n=1 Tax=Halorubellus sp. PRR65 TaxID=3098148 RepID=UPI002B256DE8|nr:hypothetical protein [Halorubellus sp. PRR65]